MREFKILSMLVIIAFIATTYSLNAQSPVTQIEGFLEVYHPEDNSSIYIGKDAGSKVDHSLLLLQSNSFFGSSAGKENISGSYNSLFGYLAGSDNEQGTGNSMFGSFAGTDNIGKNNSFFGRSAGTLNLGGETNSFFGYFAGLNSKDGDHNTFIGGFSGNNNINGSYNVALGYGAELSMDSLNYATAIGAGATVDTDNTIVLGRAEEKVSIPGRLEVGTGSVVSTLNSIAVGRASLASGNISSAFGDNARATGEVSTAIGFGVEATGFHSISLGHIAKATGNYSTAIGKDISTNSKSGAMILGDSNPGGAPVANVGANDQMVARFASGYFFITGPSAGVVAGPGANMWSAISDVHKKENFQYLDDKEVLSKLASVDYSSWNYKGQDSKQFRHYGIMAQDFYRLFGQDDYGTIGEDTLVNPTDMMGIAMSAIKGAKLEIEELKMVNAILLKRLMALEMIISPTHSNHSNHSNYSN